MRIDAPEKRLEIYKRKLEKFKNPKTKTLGLCYELIRETEYLYSCDWEQAPDVFPEFGKCFDAKLGGFGQPLRHRTLFWRCDRNPWRVKVLEDCIELCEKTIK